MQSTAADVSAYLEVAPPERHAALTRLRALCRETLLGYEETMAYGMPTYQRDGVAAVAFANQKHYISLYILKEEVLQRHKPTLQAAKIRSGKSCINFTKPERIPFELVQALLADTVRSASHPC